jgi:hypothetical protein
VEKPEGKSSVTANIWAQRPYIGIFLQGDECPDLIQAWESIKST